MGYQGLGCPWATRLGEEVASRISELENGDLHASPDLSDCWAPDVSHQICTDGLGADIMTVPGWALLILAQLPFFELSKVAILPPVILPAYSVAFCSLWVRSLGSQVFLSEI